MLKRFVDEIFVRPGLDPSLLNDRCFVPRRRGGVPEADAVATVGMLCGGFSKADAMPMVGVRRRSCLPEADAVAMVGVRRRGGFPEAGDVAMVGVGAPEVVRTVEPGKENSNVVGDTARTLFSETNSLTPL